MENMLRDLLSECKVVGARLDKLEQKIRSQRQHRQTPTNMNNENYNQKPAGRYNNGVRVFNRQVKHTRQTNTENRINNTAKLHTPNIAVSNSRQQNIQQEKPRSKNPDFPKLIHNIQAAIRLDHQIDAWSRIPNSIEKNLDKIFTNINLPLMDDNIRLQLQSISDSIKSELLITAQNHLLNKQAEIKKSIKESNKTDSKWASKLAQQKVIKQNKKLKGKPMAKWLQEELDDEVQETRTIIEPSLLDAEAETNRSIQDKKSPTPNKRTPAKKRKSNSTVTHTGASNNNQPAAIEERTSTIPRRTGTPSPPTQPERITVNLPEYTRKQKKNPGKYLVGTQNIHKASKIT